MKTAFEYCAREYAAGRPFYPRRLAREIKTRLRLKRGAFVADIGAGTGLATKMLLEAGLRAIPVEPSASMRQEGEKFLRAHGWRVQFREGSAESTGLRTASVDAVLVAQAFHWLDMNRALKEFHRILRPGGGLAVTFYHTDFYRSKFFRDFEDFIRRYNPAYEIPYLKQDWRKIFRESPWLEHLRHRTLRWSQAYTVEGWVALARSFSYVRNVLSDKKLAQFSEDLRLLLRRHFRREQFLAPFYVELYTARMRR